MIKVLTAEKMRECENAVMKNGVTEDELIERAAGALFDRAVEILKKGERTAVVVGGGNNGSDGMSLALLLHEKGYPVTVYPVADNYNECARLRYQKCEKQGIMSKNTSIMSDILLDKFALVVDAMLGIGANKPLSGAFLQAAEAINNSGVYVLAVDISSGLFADTGEAHGIAVRADETITFSAAKLGHVIGEGKNYTGKLTVCDIGITCENAHMFITESVDALLPRRLPVTHKGTYGKVKIIAGSAAMPGAAMLALCSAAAAHLGGAGLVTLCVPDSMRQVFQSRVIETMLCFLPDENGDILFDENSLEKITDTADTIVIGPGLGKNPQIRKIVDYLVSNFSGNLIIDADGLNALAQDIQILKNHAGNIILTPHIGEFMRLAATDTTSHHEQIQLAKELAKKYDITVVLKSAVTAITDGYDIFFNTTGTPAMSKGGSGDVLTGLIAAYLTVLPPIKAAIAACHNLGIRGEQAEKIYGEEAVLARHLIK